VKGPWSAASLARPTGAEGALEPDAKPEPPGVEIGPARDATILPRLQRGPFFLQTT